MLDIVGGDLYLQPGLTSNLPTAGVVTVSIEQDDWNLYERPQTELLLHDYPKKHKRSRSKAGNR